MDFSIFLSTAAIIVSVAISLISWWFNFLRGPDLSLIDEPRFEFEDESFKRQGTTKYVPTWFNLKPVNFVFANNGKKSGTIIDLNLKIIPDSSIKDYYTDFFVNFGTYEEPDLPVVIAEGDIKIIQASIRIDFINWKKNALTQVLDSRFETKDLVEKALIKSKEIFRIFYNFLESSKEIAQIICVAKMSKGNDIKEVKIGEYKIKNNFDETLSSLRKCLLNWENISPTRNELVRELETSYRDIINEIRENKRVAKISVDENNINTSRLRLDAFERLQKAHRSDRELRWFLIKSKEGLERELTYLYRQIVDYNSIIEEALFLGNLRTAKNIKKINDFRINLLPALENLSSSLVSFS